MRRLITVSSHSGKPTINTSGFTGDTCLKATEKLEAALGGTVVDHERNSGEPEEQEKQYEGGY